MITHIIYEIVGRKVGCCKNIKTRMRQYEREEGIRPKFIRIRERLEDMTDQEAGDREWYWADVLHYPRGTHYTLTMRAVKIRNERKTPEQKIEIARMGGLAGGRKGGLRRMENATPEEKSELGRRVARYNMDILTPEERSESARKAAHQANKNMTLEQRIENTRKADLKRSEILTAEQLSEIGRKGYVASIAILTTAQQSENGRKGAQIVNKLGLGGFAVKDACPHCGKEGNLANLKRWHFDNCPHKPKTSTPRLVRRAA